MPRSFPLLTFLARPLLRFPTLFAPAAACLPLFSALLVHPLRLPCCNCTLHPQTRDPVSAPPPRGPPQKRHSHTPTAQSLLPPSHPIHPFHISQSAVSVSVSAASLARSPCLCLRPRPLAPLSHTTPRLTFSTFLSFPTTTTTTHPTAVSSLFLFLSLLSRLISLRRNPSLLHYTVFFSAVLLYTNILRPAPFTCRSDPSSTTFIRSRPQTRPYLELELPVAASSVTIQKQHRIRRILPRPTSYLPSTSSLPDLPVILHLDTVGLKKNARSLQDVELSTRA